MGQEAGLHADLPARESWGADLQTVGSGIGLAFPSGSLLEPLDLSRFSLGLGRSRSRRCRSLVEDEDLVGISRRTLISLGKFGDRIASAVIGSGLGSNVHALSRSILYRDVVVFGDE